MIEPGKKGHRSGSVAKGRCEAGRFAKNGRPLVRWILTATNGLHPAPADTSETPLRASPGTASTGPSRASSPAS